ncbi:MAG TPA: hypothetical protein VFY91_15795 [Microbacterium sp.]|nr:hypothetical protein [Microbacterium sp.]
MADGEPGGGGRAGGRRRREGPRRGRPRKERHEELSPEEDAEQRGADTGETIGANPRFEDPTREDPGWEGGSGEAEEGLAWLQEFGRERRPNREDVLPYLLIRAFAPGDRGQRPVWPPTPTWISPDIHLMDASIPGDFDPSQSVVSPTAGSTYRVFVHVWNLGLLPAAGVLVRAWHVAPGYFVEGGVDDASYTPEIIGGAFVDLAARTAPGAHRLVELMPPWAIDPALTGHECLLAAATCIADPWSGVLDANAHRHVGQRNLDILGPGASLLPILGILGGQVAEGAYLEIFAEGRRGDEVEFFPLFAASSWGDRLAVVPAERFDRVNGRPGEMARVLVEIGDGVFDWDPDESLEGAFIRRFDTDDPGRVLEQLEFEQLDLHFAQFGREGEPGGGYTVRLVR